MKNWALLTQRAVAALDIAANTAELRQGRSSRERRNRTCRCHSPSKLGTPVRKVLGKGAARSVFQKRGGLKSYWTSRSATGRSFRTQHFDGMEVRINDAPRANEIMVAIAITDGGRPPRVVVLPRSNQGKTASAKATGDGLQWTTALPQCFLSTQPQPFRTHFHTGSCQYALHTLRKKSGLY